MKKTPEKGKQSFKRILELLLADRGETRDKLLKLEKHLEEIDKLIKCIHDYIV